MSALDAIQTLADSEREALGICGEFKAFSWDIAHIMCHSTLCVNAQSDGQQNPEVRTGGGQCPGLAGPAEALTRGR